MPILLSKPIPSATFSTSAPHLSQILETALINEIFVARNEFDACFIISALLISVTTIFEFNGLYISFKIFSAFFEDTPITILSGLNVSYTAEPSLRNSGFDATSK